MSAGLLVLLASTLAAWWLSGSRSWAQLAYFLSFAPFMTLDVTDGGLQNADGLDSELVRLKMLLRISSGALIVLLFLRRRAALGLVRRVPLWPAFFFVGWSLVGLIGAAEPLLALLRLGELGLFVLLGLLLWSDSDRAPSLRALLRVHALALVPLIATTAFYAARYPALALHVGDGGLVRAGNRLINAETLGTLGALLTLWASFELKEPRERRAAWWRERALPLACLAIAVPTLLLARSRTAMIATLVGECVLWMPLFGATRRQWTITAALALVALLAATTQVDAIQQWFLRGEGVENLRTGTGRTELWAHLLDDAVPQSPLLGHGYLNLSERGGFWHAGSYWTNAHNAYLAALLYAGLPGLLAVLALLAWPVRSAWRRARARGSERGAWALVLALGCLFAISSLTSFGICGWPNPLMLFFYALYPVAVLGRRAPPHAALDDASAERPASDEHAHDESTRAWPAGA